MNATNAVGLKSDSQLNPDENFISTLSVKKDQKLKTMVNQPLPVTAFLFTGLGSLYPGMGKQLYRKNQIFKNTMDQSHAILESIMAENWKTLFREEDPGRAAYAMPILFALEYSLFQTWLSKKIKPEVVAGYSAGEYAAACAAGIFSLEEGLELMVKMGELFDSLQEKGAMAAIQADEASVEHLISGVGNVVIAAANGEQNTVVSGPAREIYLLADKCQGSSIKVRLLNISNGFHSPVIDVLKKDFLLLTRAMTLHPPEIKIVSCVTGKVLDGDEILEPVYWADLLGKKILFRTVLSTLKELKVNIFLEIGPSPHLTGFGKLHPELKNCDWVPSLVKGQDDNHRLFNSARRLYWRGVALDMEQLYSYVDRSHKKTDPDLSWKMKAQSADAVGENFVKREPLFSPKASEGFIAGIVCDIMDFEPDFSTPLMTVGFDSLMALQFKERLLENPGIDFPVSFFSDAVTIISLAEKASELFSIPGKNKTAWKIRPDEDQRYSPFPLTDVQHAYRVGRTDTFELGNVSCHLYLELDMVHCDVEKAECALNRAVKRHDALRTVFIENGKQRVLLKVPEYKIKIMDPGSELMKTRREMSHQVLPEDTWPLFEVRAQSFSRETTRLFISFDLLIGDAWSLLLLSNELAGSYIRPESELPRLELLFRDYVMAEEHRKKEDTYSKALEYWKKRLPELPPGPCLPLVCHPSKIKKPHFVRHTSKIDSTLWTSLKEKAAACGFTPSVLLITVFTTILNKYSKSSRFCTNITMFNRKQSHPQINDIVGDSTSIIFLETEHLGQHSFKQQVRQTQRQLLNDLEHSSVSAVTVAQEMRKICPDGLTPVMPVVFTSMLSLTKDKPRGFFPEHIDLTVPFAVFQTPQVWLDHQVYEQEGNLVFNWDVVEALFPEHLIDNMFSDYCLFVRQLVEAEADWDGIFRTHLCAEQADVRTKINATETEMTDKLLHTLFFSQARQTPHSPAVITPEISMDYETLARWVSAMGKRLAKAGTDPNALIGVLLKKGWEQVVSVLGILTSGAAYLPVDPDLPEERINHILQHGKVETVIATSEAIRNSRLPDHIEVVDFQSITLADQPVDLMLSGRQPEDLAYVIYTSGSTGLPKGVMISHKGAVNTVLDINRRFSVSSRDRILALSELNFDLSVYDIFGTLAAGGALVMPSSHRKKDPAHWIELIETYGVTIWNSVPSLMGMLVKYRAAGNERLPETLRLSMMSGDFIPLSLPEKIKKMANNIEIYSLGGATEASIWSVLYPIKEVLSNWQSIPYGRPMANQKLHILNASMEDCPDWVSGDLYISGTGLALGYWRDTGKTQASFIKHPVTRQRLYRTGDIGRYLPGGDIEFIGREDNQVKIRGYRIELGEIEAVVRSHREVSDAVVITTNESSDNKHLIAFVVPAKERQTSQTPEQESFHAENVLIHDTAERLEFKLKRKGIREKKQAEEHIPLSKPVLDNALTSKFSQRTTYREFIRDIPLEKAQFGKFLECLMAVEVPELPFPKYRYGSAGGLYPLQIYIYVKPEKINEIPGAAYYYNPVRHDLELLSNGPSIDRTIFTRGNDEIFDASAFTLFLIADMDAISPLYGEYSEHFCTIEAGAVTQLLETNTFSHDIGLCQIGVLDFDKIRRYFKLLPGHRFIHCLLGGRIHQEKGWSFIDTAARAMSFVKNLEKTIQKENQNISENIRQHLAGRLPDYMVPSKIIPLDILPLTPTGKIDRVKLEQIKIDLKSKEDTHVPPANPIESKMAGICARILQISPVSMHDNFFRSGGDSLLAIQLIADIRKAFEIELPLKRVFDTSNLRALSREVKKYLAAADADKTIVQEYPTVTTELRQRHQPFPLTDIQHAYWIGRKGIYELGNISTHIYFELETQDMDIGCLSRAWQKLIRQHEALRSVILTDGQQKILDRVPDYRIEAVDLSCLTPKESASAQASIRREMSHQVLPAGEWPLFDIRVSRIKESSSLLHLSFDALIIDMWSMFKLISEWHRLYKHPEDNLPSLNVSFRDYVLTEAEFRKGPIYDKDRQYWKKRLPLLPPAPDLPVAVAPGLIRKPHFVRHKAVLDARLWSNLKKAGSLHDLTPSGILLSAFAEILGYWSSNPSFTINLTLFNRLPFHPEINDIVGDFTSLTLLEVNLDKTDSFLIQSRKIQGQLWDDIDHRSFNGISVLRELTELYANKQRAVMPVVFTSALSSGGFHHDASALNAFGRYRYGVSQTPQVWLDHQVMEQNGKLVFNWDVVDSLFPDGLIEDMFEAYYCLLKDLAAGTERWDARNVIHLPQSQKVLMARTNATCAPVFPELLHTMFFKCAKAMPDNTAIISPELNLSYHALSSRVSVLSAYLQEYGLAKNDTIAVVMDKGWEQVAAVLAVLQSGAVFLPLDSGIPESRRNHILSDSFVKIILTQSWINETASMPQDIPALCVDKIDFSSPKAPFCPLPLSCDDPAYIIYTSGSTGVPKGVVITHKGAVNTILDINNRFSISSRDRILALSALNFDLSIYDIFGTLSAGAALVMHEPGNERNPEQWAKLILKEKITVWNSVPALMEMLLTWLGKRAPAYLASLRLVMLSGDWLPIHLAEALKQVCKDCRTVSLGGATEASIWSILYQMDKIDPEWKSIPYGMPMVNQTFCILNKNMTPCPVWVPGQMYIGGTGLAKEYQADKEKTDKAFILHPETGERLYRTGDFGRYLPDGNIEFLGREDDQVKINGYRIELGEIEETMRQHPGVKNAVAVSAKGRSDKKYLAVYTLLHKDHKLFEYDLISFLKAKLPEYMVPEYLAIMDVLPLTPTGKVDRKNLPLPEKIPSLEGCNYSAPETGLEKIIANAVTTIIEVEKPSIHAKFFDMGANSLDIVKMCSLISEKIESDISITNFFEYPTIKSLADHLICKNTAPSSKEKLQKKIAARRKAAGKKRKSRIKQ